MMASGSLEVRVGMTVCGTDGQKIGTVTEVYVRSPGWNAVAGLANPFGATTDTAAAGDASAAGAASSTLADNLAVEQVPQTQMPGGYNLPSGAVGSGNGSDQPRSSDTAGGTGRDGDYFKVDRGGILGIGAKELYVPYTDVKAVTSEGVIRLGCPRNRCDERYAEKPAFLREDDVADMPLV
jgi:sporulation protein YlmC with PRC-barrel domain